MRIRLSEVKTKNSGIKTDFIFTIDAPAGTEVLFRSVSGRWVSASSTAEPLSAGKYSRAGSSQQVSFEISDPEIHIYCLVVNHGRFELYNAEWVVKRGENKGHTYDLNSKDVAQIQNVLESGRTISVPFTPSSSEENGSPSPNNSVSSSNSASSIVAQGSSAAHSQSSSSASTGSTVNPTKLAAERKLKAWSGTSGLVRIVLGVIGLTILFAALIVGALALCDHFFGDKKDAESSKETTAAVEPLKAGQCISLNIAQWSSLGLSTFVKSVVPCDQPTALFKIAEVSKEKITECPSDKPDCYWLNFANSGQYYLVRRNISVGQCLYGFVYIYRNHTWYDPFACTDEILPKATLDKWATSALSEENLTLDGVEKYRRYRIESIGESEQQCADRLSKPAYAGANSYHYFDVFSVTGDTKVDPKGVCAITLNDDLYSKAK